MCSLGRSKLGTRELGSFCCVVRYLTALPHDAFDYGMQHILLCCAMLRCCRSSWGEASHTGSANTAGSFRGDLAQTQWDVSAAVLGSPSRIEWI